MKASKQKKLEAAGWKVGSTRDFLELTDAEEMIVDVKLSLAKKARELRQKKKLTQGSLAKLIGSSQSRVAKSESAEGEATIDFLVKMLAAMGASRSQIGKAVGSEQKTAKRKRSLAKTR